MFKSPLDRALWRSTTFARPRALVITDNSTTKRSQRRLLPERAPQPRDARRGSAETARPSRAALKGWLSKPPHRPSVKQTSPDSSAASCRWNHSAEEAASSRPCGGTRRRLRIDAQVCSSRPYQGVCHRHRAQPARQGNHAPGGPDWVNPRPRSLDRVCQVRRAQRSEALGGWPTRPSSVSSRMDRAHRRLGRRVRRLLHDARIQGACDGRREQRTQFRCRVAGPLGRKPGTGLTAAIAKTLEEALRPWRSDAVRRGSFAAATTPTIAPLHETHRCADGIPPAKPQRLQGGNARSPASAAVVPVLPALEAPPSIRHGARSFQGTLKTSMPASNAPLPGLRHLSTCPPGLPDWRDPPQGPRNNTLVAGPDDPGSPFGHRLRARWPRHRGSTARPPWTISRPVPACT